MDDDGQAKSAQAYQVIGFLCLSPPELPVSDDEQIRAMDYFLDTETYDEDFLPWPRT
jgi:hypothetical protein